VFDKSIVRYTREKLLSLRPSASEGGELPAKLKHLEGVSVISDKTNDPGKTKTTHSSALLFWFAAWRACNLCGMQYGWMSRLWFVCVRVYVRVYVRICCARCAEIGACFWSSPIGSCEWHKRN
jgi:hypothetical protein